MKYLLLNTVLSVVMLFSALSGNASAAGTASFSLSPSSGSYVQNSSFTVQVYENGTDVNVVTAKMSYDATKLSCSTVGGSSSFVNTIVATCSNGNVTISRYSISNVTGSALVGSLTFKVLGNSGTASISFINGSQIASNGNNVWNGITTGATYTLTAPAAVAQPSQQQPTQAAPSNNTVTTNNTNNQTSNIVSAKKVITATNQSANANASSDPVAIISNTNSAIDDSAEIKQAVAINKIVADNSSTNTLPWISVALASLVVFAGVLYLMQYRKKTLSTTANIKTVAPTKNISTGKKLASKKSSPRVNSKSKKITLPSTS